MLRTAARYPTLHFTLCCWGAITAHVLAAEPAGRVDFNRDVRPIFSNNCFACHGPDENERQAGLRLDLIEEAKKPSESGKTAIVPGQPDQSELARRIESADDAERMPPPESNKHLNDQQ